MYTDAYSIRQHMRNNEKLTGIIHSSLSNSLSSSISGSTSAVRSISTSDSTSYPTPLYTVNFSKNSPCKYIRKGSGASIKPSKNLSFHFCVKVQNQS